MKLMFAPAYWDLIILCASLSECALTICSVRLPLTVTVRRYAFKIVPPLNKSIFMNHQLCYYNINKLLNCQCDFCATIQFIVEYLEVSLFHKIVFIIREVRIMNLRLLELRKQKGWTQAEVAEKLKITPQAYSLYETSKNNINNEMLCMLADIFEVSTDYLLGRQNERPSFLSEEERSIINQYRALDERGKENIKHSLAFEYARNSNVTASKKKVKSS